MREYLGERREDGAFVEVIVFSASGHVQARWPLAKFNHVVNYSTWFEWGCFGDGPSQLAVAILTDCLGAQEAQEHYPQFTADMIARIDCAPAPNRVAGRRAWSITEPEITAWHKGQHEEPA